MLEEVEKYIKDHEIDFVERLNTLLRIPSISTASESAGDVRKVKLGAEKGFLPPSSRVALDDLSDSPVINSNGRAIFVLHFDPESEKFHGDSEADARLTKEYREPWSVPDPV